MKEIFMSDRKILIIDDDPDILDAVSAVLKSENYIVVTAMDGNEGVEKFKSEKPDLVLCDMMMERIDAGAKTAEAIRKEDKDVPIYLLSSIGNATSMNVDVSSKGFNGVLQKPVDPSNLKAEVKKALA
jgi:CheY-like chemotaxis protein